MSDPILSREQYEAAEREYGYDRDTDIAQRAFADGWQAALEALQKVCGEPAGILSVHRFRKIDSMVNWDFEYTGSLPDGSHQLYALTRSKP